MISYFFRFFVIFLIVCFHCTRTLGDSPAPPRDWVKTTENEKYILVMLASEQWADKDPEIRKRYKYSGLYRNNCSQAPLWKINWYAFDAIPSSDGRHLIRMGPWASSIHQLALAFYKNGELIKNYRIKDLVHDESQLIFTVSHFFWKTSCQFNDQQSALTLKTVDNRSYRFSIETGEILSEN